MAALIRNESEENFSFLWSVAMPLLYGYNLLRTSVILTDGDGQLCSAAETAIASRVFGDGLCYRRLCLWHTVILKFNDIYGTRRMHDDGLGDAVLKCVLFACYNCENTSEFSDI